MECERGLAMRILSVCLSVCHTRELWHSSSSSSSSSSTNFSLKQNFRAAVCHSAIMMMMMMMMMMITTTLSMSVAIMDISCCHSSQVADGCYVIALRVANQSVVTPARQPLRFPRPQRTAWPPVSFHRSRRNDEMKSDCPPARETVVNIIQATCAWYGQQCKRASECSQILGNIVVVSPFHLS